MFSLHDPSFKLQWGKKWITPDFYAPSQLKSKQIVMMDVGKNSFHVYCFSAGHADYLAYDLREFCSFGLIHI